jgi:hypothetical protein
MKINLVFASVHEIIDLKRACVSFFKNKTFSFFSLECDRLSFTLDEGLSFSLDSNLTSESTKNSNSNSNFFSWNCDKSDLGSIDSNFFKNSLHQNALSAAEGKSNTLLTETTSVSTTATSKVVSRAEIHNENTINDTGNINNNTNNGTLKLNERKSENNINENESNVNINEDTESGITIIEIKDRKQLSKPASSVISYDSIYLSSESDRQTVLGETSSNFEDIDSKIKDFEKIIRELNLIGDIEKSDSIIDNLYSQVAKGAVSSTTELDLSSAFIDSNLDGLNKYNDYISKGTLDRLKILSGFALKESSLLEGCNKGEENKSKDNKTFQYQYASLPDVDISKLLRDCELIDAKLRDDVSIELLEPYPDYDLNSSVANNSSIHYATTTTNNSSNLNSLGSIYKVSQTKQIEANTTEPLSLEEEENPKGAPSIELVLLPTKEVNNGNTKSGKEIIKQPQTQKENTPTKIYLPDLGLELDYENSIVSAEEESNEDEEEEFHSLASQQKQELRHYQPPSFNLVTISGRKVIVDELAAKTEQQQQRVDNNNSKDSTKSKAQKHSDETKALTKQRKEGKSISSTSSTSFPSAKNGTDKVTTKKHINEKINGSDNRQTNIDKREESKQAKKINLPECKQQSFADSTADKKILFRKKSNPRDLEEVAIQLSFEKVNGNTVGGGSGKKDYTSFCILQTNGGSVNSSNNSNNMPRPQLLNIIDSKNSAPKHNQVPTLTPQKHQRSNNKLSDVRIVMTTDVDMEKPLMLNETEKEFQHKVDSVRNYWSKILDSDNSETKHSTLKKLSKAFSASKSSSDIPSSLRNEDFQSFFPSVEIVELNGETQTALVTSRKLNDEEFDHVRYKVMRSEMFQKNLASNNNRKETQFDGLMQYLQDYSFQELLANNNVVIIEPVRTKIEKISDKPNKAQSGACKITNGAAALNRSGSNNLKKHFFYHPIRVNKELYEDELPTPDTVRNVRKLFEESLRMGCGKKICEKSKMFKSSDNLKQKKTIRYLTIDTSYDNNLATSKWDSISLSSGVSSAADLNSPCECHDNSNRNACITTSSNGSKENLDSNEGDDSIDKSNFVGSDVLEKLRECGSSVTFYGDRKSFTQHVNENDRNQSEYTTKAIMKEVQKCNNSARQSRGLSSAVAATAYHNGGGNCEKISTKKISASDYTGMNT